MNSVTFVKSIPWLMKKSLFFTLFALLWLGSYAQLPQFSPMHFEGWIYNNPFIELTSQDISNNRIVLYKTTQGFNYTLTSPEFPCRMGQTIDMTVTWVTEQWKNSNFDVSKVALTAAILDENDVALDSVTYRLTSSTVSRTNYLEMSIAIPRGLTTTSLRFAAWKADVNSLGAVRQVVVTSTLHGDVNLDGEVNIADVNAVTDIILGADADEDLRHRADVNRDNEVGVADINSVIDIIMG